MGTGKTGLQTVGRQMTCQSTFRRSRRRMKRCLASMEMDLNSFHGEKKSRDE